MLADEIKSVLCGDNFAWFYNPTVVYAIEKAGFQFTHSFFADNQQMSTLFEMVKPLIYIAEIRTGQKIKGIHRIKANLRVPSNIPDALAEIHQDKIHGNFMTLLYYVNDADGDTEFYADDKKTLVKTNTPVANSAVWFDSKLWHKSSPPVTSKTRVVINFILEVEV